MLKVSKGTAQRAYLNGSWYRLCYDCMQTIGALQEPVRFRVWAMGFQGAGFRSLGLRVKG